MNVTDRQNGVQWVQSKCRLVDYNIVGRHWGGRRKGFVYICRIGIQTLLLILLLLLLICQQLKDVRAHNWIVVWVIRVARCAVKVFVLLMITQLWIWQKCSTYMLIKNTHRYARPCYVTGIVSDQDQDWKSTIKIAWRISLLAEILD